jgi:hypothetical protein
MYLTQNQIEKANKFHIDLIEKSWNDSVFKENLINSPLETSKEVKLGNSKEFVVEDQTDSDTIFLNIPPKPNLDEIELSDEQLEHVSGGEVGVLLTIATAWWIGGAFVVGTGIGVAAKLSE